MRDIRFRVWTGYKMEYDVLVGKLGAFYVHGLDPKDSACVSPMNTIYSKETPVMQFTGLHDKKGNEIWEGDILSNPWHDGECGVVEYDGNEFDPNMGYVETHEMMMEESEVLGNIYANPELHTEGGSK